MTEQAPTTPPEAVSTEAIVEDLKGVLSDAREDMLREVHDSVNSLRNERGRPAPIPPKEGPERAQAVSRSRAEPPHMLRSYRFGWGEVREGIMELYATLPEDQQKWRNPKLDELARTYILASVAKDRASMEKTKREMDDYYVRAALLEGDPDASSGFADGTGAELLPLPLHGAIINARQRASVLPQLMQNFQMSSQTLRIPGGPAVTASMVSENSVATDATPDPSSILLSAKKGQVQFSASMEELEDSAFNIVSWFSERGGSALGLQRDTQICTSNGTAPNITESLESATITEVTEAAAGTLTFVDVMGLYFGLPKQYRRDAIWLGSSEMMQFLSTIVDANGRPIFNPGLSAPSPIGDAGPAEQGNIMGRPVYDVPLTDGGLFIGSPGFYAFGSRMGIRIQASADAGWDNDVVKWKITERFDGSVIFGDAWRKTAGITAVG